MRTFTREQVDKLYYAMRIYKQRSEGMTWQAISDSCYFSLRTCHNYHAYAKRALERMHGFDNHSTYD